MRNTILLALAAAALALSGCGHSSAGGDSIAVSPPSEEISNPASQGSSSGGPARSGRMGGMAPSINKNAPDAAAHLGTKLDD